MRKLNLHMEEGDMVCNNDDGEDVNYRDDDDEVVTIAENKDTQPLIRSQLVRMYQLELDYQLKCPVSCSNNKQRIIWTFVLTLSRGTNTT